MIYPIAALLIIALWLAIDHAIFKEPEGGYYRKSYDCQFCKDTGFTRNVQYPVSYASVDLGLTPSVRGSMPFQPCPHHQYFISVFTDCVEYGEN